MQAYTIFLRNDKTRVYDRFALGIFLLNTIALVSVLIYTGREAGTNDFIGLYIAVAVAVFISPAVAILKKDKKNLQTVIIVNTVVIVIAWAYLGYWWTGLVIAFLVYLYLVSKKEPAVLVGPKKIIYPSFPERNIQWEELSNLLLKDRLLTIDFKNNKLIQQDIGPKSYTINEREFNDFCSRQIKLASTQPG
jgi:membrane protease YdiL (CAAX protease family)